MKHVVGFSGGIDSQACARWVLNRHDPADVILLNSDVGGHEHWITTDFIRRYSETVHPVTVVSPTVADMGTRARAEIERRGLRPTDPLTFGLMAELKGVFPSRRKQFCTEHLKLRPAQRWMAANLARGEWVRYSGVRRQEGKNNKSWRTQAAIEGWDDFFQAPLYHPIADWSKDMCFSYCELHGEEVNPLYRLGFKRVGCAPCVNSNKEDIRQWAMRYPEQIDKVREMERTAGKSFFMPMVPGMEINWIDDVVRWSKTTHGGKQFSLNVLYEPAACESAYGLCE